MTVLQLHVLSDMTILKVSEQNTMLQKNVEKLEDQELEARRTIRALHKQLNSPRMQPQVIRKSKTSQTTEAGVGPGNHLGWTLFLIAYSL